MRFRFLVLIWLGIILVLVSPASAYASEGNSKWGIWLDIGKLFNLALVIAILIWGTRKPLARFFSARTQLIREQLAEAQRARAQAEARLAEMEARMSRLDDELTEIQASAEKEAREEYQRLVAAAEQESGKMLERTRQEIESMVRAAKQELRIHTAELLVKMAEENIRKEIGPGDHKRLLASFIDKLGEKQ